MILVACALVTLLGIALNVPSVIGNLQQASAVAVITGGSYASFAVAIVLPTVVAGLLASVSLWHSLRGNRMLALRYSVLASVAHAFIFFGLWVWGIGATPLSTISTASFVS